MKVGDKVKVIGGYGGDFNGRFGVLTEISGGWCMVTTRKGLPEHTGDSGRPDDDFHLCFLKSQVSAPTQHIGTLSEIGAQVGDVVEALEKCTNPYLMPIGPVMVGSGKVACGIPLEQNSYQWRIVSRASDYRPSESECTEAAMAKGIDYPTQQTGPVITETVKRIVPGMYGKVSVLQSMGWWFALTETDDKVAHVKLSAAELCAAIATLTQIADAMPHE